MAHRRDAFRIFVMLTGWTVLFGMMTGCSAFLPQTASLPMAKAETSIPLTAVKSPYVLPPTWTVTPTPKRPQALPSQTPTPTFNIPQTLIARTTVVAGVRCQRHADAWQVYSGPAGSYAGWCLIVGAYGTLYEYKLLSPHGWVVNTFGEFTPNLAFSTGEKNVQVKVHQAFAYNHRNYDGTLGDAPEKAAICDENEKCYGFLDPNETLIRQEITKVSEREVLVLDSELGPLRIRRYYMILPFRVNNHSSQRLFIIEASTLDTALTQEEYDRMLEKLDIMVGSISQR
jgi:hypothetical protein